MPLRPDDFRDLRDEITEMANNFEQMARKHDRATVREAIEGGVSNAFEEIVVEARQRAERHVPLGHASLIMERSRGWQGGEYQHEVFSSSVVVASHEFGSGLYSINNRGTIDVPGKGYYIPKPRSKGPIRLTSHPADTNNSPVIVEYVVHPGVRPKRFIHQTIEDNRNLVNSHVGGELSRVMHERGMFD